MVRQQRQPRRQAAAAAAVSAVECAAKYEIVKAKTQWISTTPNIGSTKYNDTDFNSNIYIYPQDITSLSPLVRLSNNNNVSNCFYNETDFNKVVRVNDKSFFYDVLNANNGLMCKNILYTNFITNYPYGLSANTNSDINIGNGIIARDLAGSILGDNSAITVNINLRANENIDMKAKNTIKIQGVETVEVNGKAIIIEGFDIQIKGSVSFEGPVTFKNSVSGANSNFKFF